MKIKFLALIIGLVCFVISCDNKDSCDHGHKSHDKKQHRNKMNHFGRMHGSHHSMNPDSMAKFRSERMKKELSLTEEQIPQVEQVNLKYANKMKEIRKLMRQVEEERSTELSGILTKEQLEKLKSMKGHHKRAAEDSVHDDN